MSPKDEPGRHENWLYAKTAQEFVKDADAGTVGPQLLARSRQRKEEPDPSELTTWHHSPKALAKVMEIAKVTRDQLVVLEYAIPRVTFPGGDHSMRIDALICGADSDGQAHAVTIESKMWDENYRLDEARRRGSIMVQRRGGMQVKPHPSIQARLHRDRLGELLRLSKQERESIRFSSFAYLHNIFRDLRARQQQVLCAPQFDAVRAEVPLYTANHAKELASGLHERVGKGRGREVFSRLLTIQTEAEAEILYGASGSGEDDDIPW